MGDSLARFEEKFCPEPNTGCWLWTACVLSTGYGGFQVDGLIQRAHRVSWMLYVGPIPPGLLVLHRCDTPLCVNPSHLFLGTNADNNADMVAKGRVRCGVGDRNGARTHPEKLRRGTANPAAKLSDAAVVAIRGLVEDGFSQREVGAFFGVCQAHVSRLVLGQQRRA